MTKTEKKQIAGSLTLALTAFIWGVSFVSQRVGMDYVGPLTFTCLRCALGAAVLVPVVLVTDKMKGKAALAEERKNRKTLFIGGTLCGVVFAVGSIFQQYGIKYTSVGKSGFITALYIVIIPVFGLFLKRKIRPLFFVSVALATVGMYLLCINESFSVNKGDLLVFVCAVCFAAHILIIDWYSPKVNCVKMACIQFAVCGILCAAPMFILERPSLSAVAAAYEPLLYSGVLSCGVAYTLQMISQKNVNPVAASLIMSLESVFCALASWVLLGERLSFRETAGCVIIFAGIIIAQLPKRKKKIQTA